MSWDFPGSHIQADGMKDSQNVEDLVFESYQTQRAQNYYYIYAHIITVKTT